MKPTIIRKRLQIQPPGRTGLDRSVVFVVGELTLVERRKLRGVIFEATSKLDALKQFREVHALAKEAVDKGDVPGFLEALDNRTRHDRDAGPTFESFSEEWRTTAEGAGDLRETMTRSDEQVLRLHLRPFFGRYHLRDIDPRLVDRYKLDARSRVHQYGTGLHPHTINNHLSVVHRIFEKAIEYGLAEKNPVTRNAWLAKVQTAEDRQNWLTPEEEGRVFRVLIDSWAAKYPDRYLVLMTQLIIGARYSEMRVLEKRDLDLNAPGIRISRSKPRNIVSTPKNKRARFQPIPRELADKLREYMLRTEGQLLFPAPGGDCLSNNVLNRWWAELCAEAGVRRITSHGARHTSGSTYATMGVGQKMIAGLLGHSTTATTERYTHVQVGAGAALVNARWLAMGGAEPAPASR